ncbi:hypothetical protein WG922_21845 [Ramlibacter sp. AN1015]|uniref:hypothetical protein n=1 Tax=Ramlibacter sp. AN1015 TaxID=3133428 RepID=UPI0030BED404
MSWNVTDCHVCPRYKEGSLIGDPWYGAGRLLAQLANFGNPLHINKFSPLSGCTPPRWPHE